MRPHQLQAGLLGYGLSPVTQAYAGSGGGAASQTLSISTNTAMPVAISTAGQSGMCRRAHFSLTGITSIQAVHAGWYVNVGTGFLGQEIPSGAYNASFWVEYPQGTYTQVDNSIAVTPGSNTLGGTLSITIPANTQFWTWAYYTGALFPFYNTTSPATVLYATGNEACNINTTGVPTTPGAITDNGSHLRALGPVVLIGPSTGKSIACLGDSRTFGTGDQADASTNRGNLSRSVGTTYNYINLGVGSDDPSMWLYGAVNRKSLITSYCTHVVDELGINLFNNRGMSSAESFPYKARIQASLNLPYVMTTLEPKSSSTDNWTTAANQTVLLPESATWNTTVRALPNYIELRIPVEDQANLGKWITNGTTANLETVDGLHPSQTGYLNQAATSSSIITAINNATLPSQTQPSITLTSGGTVTYDTSTPKFGTAALSGGFGYLPGFMSGLGTWTLECWYKSGAAGVGNQIYIFALVDLLTSSPAFGLVNNSSGVAAYRGVGGGITASTVSIIDNTWHHLALVYNGSSGATLYVDGNSSATSATALPIGYATTLAVKFNGNVSSPSIVNGEIDEVACWNSAKYTTNFIPPTQPYTGSEPNLIGVWHMDSNMNGTIGPAIL